MKRKRESPFRARVGVDPYWTRFIHNLTNPDAVERATRLDLELNPLGHEKSKIVNLKDRFIEEKTRFPRHVILIQIGAFFEATGLDAIMLAEFCGCNFKGPNPNNIEVGFQKDSVQQYVDMLVQHDLRIKLVCEIKARDMSTSREIPRKILQTLSRQNPTVYCVETTHESLIQSSYVVGYCEETATMYLADVEAAVLLRVENTDVATAVDVSRSVVFIGSCSIPPPNAHEPHIPITNEGDDYDAFVTHLNEVYGVNARTFSSNFITAPPLSECTAVAFGFTGSPNAVPLVKHLLGKTGNTRPAKFVITNLICNASEETRAHVDAALRTIEDDESFLPSVCSIDAKRTFLKLVQGLPQVFKALRLVCALSHEMQRHLSALGANMFGGEFDRAECAESAEWLRTLVNSESPEATSTIFDELVHAREKTIAGYNVAVACEAAEVEALHESRRILYARFIQVNRIAKSMEYMKSTDTFNIKPSKDRGGLTLVTREKKQGDSELDRLTEAYKAAADVVVDKWKLYVDQAAIRLCTPAIKAGLGMAQIYFALYHHVHTCASWCFGELSEGEVRAEGYFPCWISPAPVQNSIVLQKNAVLTGPNAFGKSTTLRSLASLYILHRAGLKIPASRLQSPWHRNVSLVLISGDDVALQQSRHQVDCYALAGALKRGGAVLFDEIFSGTSFQDGSKLMLNTLKYAENSDMYTLFSTHMHHVVHKVKQTQKLQMNPNENYEVIDGVCENSLGIKIAGDCGLPTEIIEGAFITEDFEETESTTVPETSSDSDIDNLAEYVRHVSRQIVQLDRIEREQSLPAGWRDVLYVLVEGRSVYVGQTDNWNRRMDQHEHKRLRDNSEILVSRMASLDEAKQIETELINHLKRYPCQLTLVSLSDGNKERPVIARPPCNFY